MRASAVLASPVDVTAAASLRIADYTLDERLGEGGGGQVYRATDREGQTVAIKLLGPAADLDPETARARFRREVAILAQLDHPALVHLLAHGVDDELGPYLVMPLLPGTTLRALVGVRPCPEAALLLVEPVASAIAALHAKGLVHRDLKPENVMVTPDGRVVVVDLGLAWGPDLSRHTSDGVAIGSVPYMAPEQLEGHPVTSAADTWALGVLLYELVAGRRPFARGRASEEAAAILVGAFAPLDAVDPRSPPELVTLVARCLARDPAARPTAALLAAELAALIDWAEPTAWPRERAAIAAAPADYPARVAPFRIRRAKRLAREAIEATRPFEALAHVDRALAYAPHDPELLSLAEQAEARTARPAPAPTPTPALPRIVDSTVGSGTVAATPTSGPAPAHRRRSALPLALVAIASAGIATSATIAITSGGDAAAPTEPAPSSETTTTTIGTADDARVMFGLFRTLLEKATDADVKRPTPTPPPTAPTDVLPDRLLDLAPLEPSGLPNTGTDRVAEMRAPAGENLIPIERLDQPDPVRAVAEVDAAVAKSPDRLNRLSQAMVYVAAGKTREGLALLDKLLADHPDYGRAWAARGYLDTRRGDGRAADRAMTRAIELDPDDAESLRNRGILRARMGRTRDAYVDLVAALRRSPTDVEAMSELAQIYSLANRRDDARPLLERIVKLRPDNLTGWLDLSLVQPSPEAVVSIRRVLAVQPAHPRANVRLCTVLAEAGGKDAVAACTKAVATAPDDPWAWMGRGLARYQLANDTGGLDDVDRAIAMNPGSAQFHINRYILRSHAGMHDAALADLRKACSLGKREACDKLPK
jgi:eukaryotic-like serine/threonine-protein kinase